MSVIAPPIADPSAMYPSWSRGIIRDARDSSADRPLLQPSGGSCAGCTRCIVLGYVPWQLRFGGRQDIVGRTIGLNGTTFTVVGVAPEGLKGLNGVFGPDVWIPSSMTEQVVPAEMRSWLRDRAALGFRAVGRLRPGVTRAEAESTIATLGRSLQRDYPDANRGRGLGSFPSRARRWPG